MRLGEWSGSSDYLASNSFDWPFLRMSRSLVMIRRRPVTCCLRGNGLPLSNADAPYALDRLVVRPWYGLVRSRSRFGQACRQRATGQQAQSDRDRRHCECDPEQEHPLRHLPREGSDPGRAHPRHCRSPRRKQVGRMNDKAQPRSRRGTPERRNTAAGRRSDSFAAALTSGNKTTWSHQQTTICHVGGWVGATSPLSDPSRFRPDPPSKNPERSPWRRLVPRESSCGVMPRKDRTSPVWRKAQVATAQRPGRAMRVPPRTRSAVRAFGKAGRSALTRRATHERSRMPWTSARLPGRLTLRHKTNGIENTQGQRGTSGSMNGLEKTIPSLKLPLACPRVHRYHDPGGRNWPTSSRTPDHGRPQP